MSFQDNIMAQQTNSVRIVFDKCMRHPMMQNLSLETMVDYAIDFMRIMGVPDMFEKKTAVIDIKKFKGKLPCDYYDMIQVRGFKSKKSLTYESSTFEQEAGSLSYRIQNNYIFTDIECGRLEISYYAIQQDEDGFPLIPENSEYYRALELYIKKQWFTILFDMGKIDRNVLFQAQQDYAWAAGACANEFKRLTIDKMESFSNSYKSMILRQHEHEMQFHDAMFNEYNKVH